MKTTLVNIAKGLIKIPFIIFFIFLMLPLMILSELEDLGSGKGWGNNGFFYELLCKLGDFIFETSRF